MSNVRANRVAEQMKKELGIILQREIKDPRVEFVTVTGVEVSGDLSQAKVYVTVMGDDEKKSEALAALKKATGFIRSEIGQRIRLRHVPELLFRWDTSIDHGNRIEQILKQLNDAENGSNER